MERDIYKIGFFYIIVRFIL